MRITGILLSGLVLFISCSKDKDNDNIAKTPAQLLTEKHWVLLTAGFDDNQNGVVDNNENILAECQKGNIYIFKNTGTGSIQDVASTCTPATPADFSWNFADGDKKLKISFQDYSILKLTDTELVISPDLPLDRKFIMTHGH